MEKSTTDKIKFLALTRRRLVHFGKKCTNQCTIISSNILPNDFQIFPFFGFLQPKMLKTGKKALFGYVFVAYIYFTKGLHSLTLRNFSIVKQKIGYFSSNSVGKLPKRQKIKKLISNFLALKCQKFKKPLALTPFLRFL